MSAVLVKNFRRSRGRELLTKAIYLCLIGWLT
jgi:hypothetical protein